MARIRGRLSVVLSRVFEYGQRRFHRYRPGKRPGRYRAVRCPADRRWRVLETAARGPAGLRPPARGDRPHRLRRPGPSGRGDRHPRFGRGPVLHLDRGAAAAGAGHLARGCESPRRRRPTDPAPADAHRRRSTPDPARTRPSGGLRRGRTGTHQDHRRDHGQSPTQRPDPKPGTCANKPWSTPPSTATRTTSGTPPNGSWTKSTPTATWTTPPPPPRWNCTSGPAPPAPG